MLASHRARAPERPARDSGRDHSRDGDGSLRRTIDRVRRFFAVKVWHAELIDFPRSRVLGYGAARTAYATVRAFFEQNLLSRAAALTYYTVLSIVPFLAFAFSVIKGLGAYDSLVQKTLWPRVYDTFDGNPQLLRAFETLFDFVSKTDVGSLGAFGLAILIYTAISLLASVADALNAIWAAPAKRSLIRQATDFVAFMVLAPVGLTVVVSLTATASAAGTTAVRVLRDRLGLGFIIELGMTAVPVAVVFIGLTLIYTVLPNLRTRLRSTIVGAAMGAVLWYGALILHVRFQIGVAGYSALYAGFGAFPIFLFWVYVSWLIVLIGAAIAASHQNRHNLMQKMRAQTADQAYREALALEVMARIGRAFLTADPSAARAWTREALAAELNAPDQIVDHVLCQLASEGIIVSATSGGSNSVNVLARDPDTVCVKDIIDAVRRDRRPQDVIGAIDEGLSDEVRAVTRGLDDEIARSPFNYTLRDLVARVCDAPSKSPAAARSS